MRVLITGMRGLGVEAAKNLILAGPKAVVIHDSAPVEIRDLGANFYLSTPFFCLISSGGWALGFGNDRRMCLLSERFSHLVQCVTRLNFQVQ